MVHWKVGHRADSTHGYIEMSREKQEHMAGLNLFPFLTSGEWREREQELWVFNGIHIPYIPY